MGRQQKNFYYNQTVNEEDLDFAFSENKGYTKDFIGDISKAGFFTQPSVTQNTPSPDFTIDFNAPQGGVTSYTELGQRIHVPASEDIDLVALNGGPFTLPASGKVRIASVFIKYAQLESLPVLDGNGVTVNTLIEDGYEFELIQGIEADAGLAEPPTTPSGDYLLLADVTLTENTTEINDSQISTDRIVMYHIDQNKVFPKVSMVQRNAIDFSELYVGFIVFNTDITGYQYWDGATWSNLGAGGSGGGESRRLDPFTLSVADITAKYVDAIFVPANASSVAVHVLGVSMQKPIVDYQVISDGNSVRRISWDGLGMESAVSSGTEIIVEYSVGVAGQIPIDAGNVTLNTTNFNQNLGSNIDDVQKLADVVDDLTFGAAATAAGTSTSTVGFNNKLSPTDTDVQQALDTLDNHNHAASEISIVSAGYSGTLDPTVNTTQKLADAVNAIQIGSINASENDFLAEANGNADKSNYHMHSQMLNITTGQHRVEVCAAFTQAPLNEGVKVRLTIEKSDLSYTESKEFFFDTDSTLDDTLNVNWLTGILPAGNYSVKFEFATQSTFNSPFNSPVGQIYAIEQNTLDANRTLQGNVTDSGLSVLSGVTVSVPAYGLTTTTDGAGDYLLSGIPAANIQVVYQQAGYSTQTITIDFTSGNQLQDVVLAQSVLSGTVLSAAGGPVTDATVTIASIPASTTTNASGFYSIPNIPDASYSVLFSSPTHIDVTGNVSVSGNTTENRTLNANTLQGVITSDSSGAQIQGANVTLSATSGISDATGNYDLEKTPEGTQNINITANGFDNFSSTVSITDGVNTQNISMVAQDTDLGIFSTDNRVFGNGQGIDNVANLVNLSRPLAIQDYTFERGDSGSNFTDSTIYFTIWNFDTQQVVHQQTDSFLVADGVFQTKAIQGSLTLPAGNYLINIRIDDSPGFQNDIGYLSGGFGTVNGSAVGSGYFTTFFDSLTGVTHYGDNYTGVSANGFQAFPNTLVNDRIYAVSLVVKP